MNNKNLIKNFKFKRGSEALLFKLSSDSVGGLVESLPNGSSDILWCHTLVDVVVSGKMTYRLAYDGSLYLADCKVAGSITYYYDTRDSSVDSSFGLGHWFAVPIEEVTPERPVEFWAEVFRSEAVLMFEREKVAYTPNRESFSDNILDYIHTVAAFKNDLLNSELPKRMSCKQWNEARLARLTPSERSRFTSK